MLRNSSHQLRYKILKPFLLGTSSSHKLGHARNLILKSIFRVSSYLHDAQCNVDENLLHQNIYHVFMKNSGVFRKTSNIVACYFDQGCTIFWVDCKSKLMIFRKNAWRKFNVHPLQAISSAG